MSLFPILTNDWRRSPHKSILNHTVCLFMPSIGSLIVDLLHLKNGTHLFIYFFHNIWTECFRKYIKYCKKKMSYSIDWDNIINLNRSFVCDITANRMRQFIIKNHIIKVEIKNLKHYTTAYTKHILSYTFSFKMDSWIQPQWRFAVVGVSSWLCFREWLRISCVWAWHLRLWHLSFLCVQSWFASLFQQGQFVWNV